MFALALYYMIIVILIPVTTNLCTYFCVECRVFSFGLVWFEDPLVLKLPIKQGIALCVGVDYRLTFNDFLRYKIPPFVHACVGIDNGFFNIDGRGYYPMRIEKP